MSSIVQAESPFLRVGKGPIVSDKAATKEGDSDFSEEMNLQEPAAADEKAQAAEEEVELPARDEEISIQYSMAVRRELSATEQDLVNLEAADADTHNDLGILGNFADTEAEAGQTPDEVSTKNDGLQQSMPSGTAVAGEQPKPQTLGEKAQNNVSEEKLVNEKTHPKDSIEPNTSAITRDKTPELSVERPTDIEAEALLTSKENPRPDGLAHIGAGQLANLAALQDDKANSKNNVVVGQPIAQVKNEQGKAIRLAGEKVNAASLDENYSLGRQSAAQSENPIKISHATIDPGSTAFALVGTKNLAVNEINPLAGLETADLDLSSPLAKDRPLSSNVSAQTSVPQGAIVTRSVVDQLVAGLGRLDNGTIEIRLSPAELGRIIFQISDTGAGQTANIVAEKADVLDLLRRNESLLETEFEEAGFVGMKFSFDQQSSADQDDSEFSSHSSSNDDTNVDVLKITPSSLLQSTTSIPLQSGLDIRL